MHDPSGAAPGEPPAPPRSGTPRHAAPEDGAAPELPAPWHPAPSPAGSRAAHRRRRGGRPSGDTGHRGRSLAAGAALLAVAAVVGVGLVRDDPDRAPDVAGSTAGPSGAPAAPPALLDWLDTELPPGGTVVLPPGLREAALQAGGDPGALPESPPEGGGDAAPPALVLVETAPAGGRLLARFDRSGSAPLLLVDPAPVEPTDEQRRRRETLAAAVLANPTTRVEGDTGEVLAAADVDPRLLTLIAGLTARDGVGLWAFPAPVGEVAGAAPARSVVVDAVGGRPVPADGAATERLVAWLEAQRAPFAPDTVEVTGDGVLVGFAYVPGPDAVVGAATS